MGDWLNHKPRSPGATARVWEIADQITRETGRTARRKDVIDRYVAEGGKSNTASTQYHYWKHAQDSADRSGGAEMASNVEAVRLTVAPDGRMVIPADMRRAMRIDASSRVMARVVDGELRVVSAPVALAQARALVRGFDSGEGSPVDELLHERRAEAGRE